MAKRRNLSAEPYRGETRQFRLEPNVSYEGVPWFRAGGVFEGEVVAKPIGMVRLYAPQGAPEPAHIDVPCYWVKPAGKGPSTSRS